MSEIRVADVRELTLAELDEVAGGLTGIALIEAEAVSSTTTLSSANITGNVASLSNAASASIAATGAVGSIALLAFAQVS
jgi:hypothetical protein